MCFCFISQYAYGKKNDCQACLSLSISCETALRRLDLISWNNKMPGLDLYFRFTIVSRDMHIYLLLKAFFFNSGSDVTSMVWPLTPSGHKLNLESQSHCLRMRRLKRLPEPYKVGTVVVATPAYCYCILLVVLLVQCWPVLCLWTRILKLIRTLY